jgi:hypothetical protein
MAEQQSGRESRLAHSLHQFLWNPPDYLVSIAHTQRGDHRAKHRQSEDKGVSVFAALALPQFLKEHPEYAADWERGCKT